MKKFNEINPQEIKGNPFKMIGKDWMLLTAGTPDNFNTMTASWGTLGELWFKPVCFCFVRPQRHTYGFMEENDNFAISFLPEEYRKQLTFCGTHSGRDTDKVEECKFTPTKAANGSVYFAEAQLVLECRKLYFQDINPENFLDSSIMKNYESNDFHRMYVAEITRALTT